MPLLRRHFLAQIAALAPSAPRPNILFAIADDQSWSGAFATRNNVLHLPAADRVAREGLRFTNSFCASPSCTPSRSAILTGRQIWQVEQAGLLYGAMPPRYPVFTHLLEDAGYAVGNTAKTWAPGNWSYLGQSRPPAGRSFNDRKLTPPVPGLDSRDYAANFADFLATRQPGQPFFFWYGGTEPHRAYTKGYGASLGKRITDIDVPPFWPDSEEVRHDILDYCAETEWFDTQLGRMLTLLEQRNELDNTLVIVTSDNGMPFPRAKVNLYDWGTHMPLAMRWPKSLPQGRTVQSFVHHMDLAPTILEAAGISPPSSMTGRSLLPLAKADDPSRDHVITGFERHTMCRPNGATYPMRAIRTATHLYIRNFTPSRWPTGGEFLSSNRTPHGDVDAGPTPDFMLANRQRFPRQFNLCFGRRPAEELYDLRSDPWQTRNLAPARTPLRAQLEAYLKSTGDPRILGQDPWQAYPYHQTSGYGASFNSTLPTAERDAARNLPRHKPE